MAPRTVRVASVQLSPIFKDVKASIARADQLVSEYVNLTVCGTCSVHNRTINVDDWCRLATLAVLRIVPGSADIVVLPEMAFTGASPVALASVSRSHQR